MFIIAGCVSVERGAGCLVMININNSRRGVGVRSSCCFDEKCRQCWMTLDDKWVLTFKEMPEPQQEKRKNSICSETSKFMCLEKN